MPHILRQGHCHWIFEPLQIRMLFPHSSLPHIWRYVPLAVMQVPLKVSYNLLPFTNCITYIHNLSIRRPTTFSKSVLMFFFIFCHSLCDNLCLAKSVVPRSGAPTLHHFPTPCHIPWITHITSNLKFRFMLWYFVFNTVYENINVVHVNIVYHTIYNY